MIALNPKIAPLASDKTFPFDLLELADPSRAKIESYLKMGACYVAKVDSRLVGLIVVGEVNSSTLEIKNLAVRNREQGKGIGKSLLRYAEKITIEKGYKKLVISTGNSSIKQLALYQKEGFEIDGITKNYFLENYPEPIFENDIQCKHLITLVKTCE